MRNFWISWYAWPLQFDGFEYHGPWWVSGYGYFRLPDGEEIEVPVMVAAVKAADLEAAKDVIVQAHDNKALTATDFNEHGGQTWRLQSEKPDDWSPFSDRFPRADWMQWPYPVR